MTYEEVMSELKSMGTEQNVKVYKRHGMNDNIFGVSFGNLRKLQKKIKKDHSLAMELWKSGNADAWHLAMMIADPEKAYEEDIDSWANDIYFYQIADLLAEYVSKTEFARKKAEEWCKSNDEWIGRAGWDLIAQLALKDQSLDDEYFEKYLEIIQRDIHSSRNYTKYAMNNALISIGMRNDSLKDKAIDAAKVIGKVDVDHGETSCKTPDAISYIEKATSRKKAKKK